MPAFVDAHNHLQDAWLAPHREQVLADLAALPLHAAVVNGTCEGDWADVAALARAHAFVRPSYGLHPWNVGNATPEWREALEARLLAAPHAAIGEIGLDRWILNRARPDDPRLAGLRRASLDEQVDALHWQLDLAARLDRPVTIHCLDAWGALAEIVRDGFMPERGFLLHAYGGSPELADEFAAAGAYFSFNGSFLAERQAARRAVFAELPADRLLAETDAPAMPLPADHCTHTLPGLADGSTINHPANIGAVYEGLAQLRQCSVASLAEQLESNFRHLFGGQ
ncbi:TatD family hydrolase [Opitutus sp. ER46]|uniref:TatD family hydrolase n=1 Tax=Opitutus sp. ER46 TaxID=2161864 RepID=UPI000D316E02|nr:TatD family hydrolase [Opitutus sp. ER46]PTX97857.1 TatD family deoxyribonuclease [Opitutus sp. ER46]